MTLTAIVSALVALVARPELREQKEVDRLRRSHRQLIDRVETLECDNQSLERELANERRLLTHWMGEASRIARHAREERDERQRLQYAPQQSQQFLAQQHGAAAQAQYAQAQSSLAGMQSHPAMQQSVFGGWCNCVPSRHQMFDAMRDAPRLVEDLNRLLGD
jgi:hypothetical protein